MDSPAAFVPRSEFTLRRRVQFYELDSAGIVHFSTYFRYMEEAEHAMWRAAGLSIHPPDASVGFPRVEVSCQYHRPLRFEEEFDLHIRIVAMTEKSIRYECVLTREGARVATGRLAVVCVTKDADGRMTSVPIPAEIRARFAIAAGAASTP